MHGLAECSNRSGKTFCLALRSETRPGPACKARAPVVPANVPRYAAGAEPLGSRRRAKAARASQLCPSDTFDKGTPGSFPLFMAHGSRALKQE